MLFYLAEYLRDSISSLNIVRYVSFRIMAAFISSITISLVLYPWFIRMLRARAVGQVIRECGPKSHMGKAGTPTMGGVLIILAIVISSLMWCQLKNPLVLLTLAVGVVFSVIGFLDDSRKLLKKNSKGLSGKLRLVLEFAFFGAAFYYFLSNYSNSTKFDLRLFIPFMNAERYWIDLPMLAYLTLGAFVVVGTANSTNLTDGLDGLVAGPIITAAGVLLILSYISGATLGGFDISRYLLIPKVVGAQELAIIASAIVGATLGFLFYNTYPAEIFMGDTGSLGLGGLLGAMAVLTKNELLSVIIFAVFLFEALSVMIQTTFFKIWGRRVFPMSPVHHSFELMGWAEPKIVVRFWIFSVLTALIALGSIKVR